MWPWAMPAHECSVCMVTKPCRMSPCQCKTIPLCSECLNTCIETNGPRCRNCDTPYMGIVKWEVRFACSCDDAGSACVFSFFASILVVSFGYLLLMMTSGRPDSRPSLANSTALGEGERFGFALLHGVVFFTGAFLLVLSCSCLCRRDGCKC